jgi:hypothetical protein
MKITMFKLIGNSAIYESRRAEPTLKSSVRKWQEAYYLIKLGFTIHMLHSLCGICYLYDINIKKKCPKCPIDYDTFCSTITYGWLSSKYPEDVEHIRWRMKHLKAF